MPQFVTRIKFQAAIMAACLYGVSLLAGCSTTGGGLRKPSPSEAVPYKHMLTVTGDISSEISEFIKKSALSTSVLLSDTPTPNGLQMQLQLMTRTQQKLDNKPALAGKLMRQSVTPVYTLRYTLSGVDGKMLNAEDVSHSGATRQVYLPQLDMALMQPDAADKKILAEKLADKILPSIQSQPWRATVLSALQLTHVLIAGGKAMGITYGDVLQTQDAPRAILQVVSFESTPDGQPRTVLRLIEGRLPAVGRTLMPTIK